MNTLEDILDRSINSGIETLLVLAGLLVAVPRNDWDAKDPRATPAGA
jgi:hypothetical protein